MRRGLGGGGGGGGVTQGAHAQARQGVCCGGCHREKELHNRNVTHEKTLTIERGFPCLRGGSRKVRSLLRRVSCQAHPLLRR